MQKNQPLCATAPLKENLVESTIYIAIKCSAFLFAYGALRVKLIPLPRYHSCRDYKHGVILPRLVGLGCSTCSTTAMKVSLKGRARRAVDAFWFLLSWKDVRVVPWVRVWYLVTRRCAREIPRTSSMGVGQGWWSAEPLVEGPSSFKDGDGDVVRYPPLPRKRPWKLLPWKLPRKEDMDPFSAKCAGV